MEIKKPCSIFSYKAFKEYGGYRISPRLRQGSRNNTSTIVSPKARLTSLIGMGRGEHSDITAIEKRTKKESNIFLLKINLSSIKTKKPCSILNYKALKEYGGYLLSRNNTSTIGHEGLNFSVRNGKR